MRSSDPLVREVLDWQVPLRLDRRPDWPDVVARSGRWHLPRSRRAPGLIALAAALAIVASALAAAGHDPFGSLGSWLSGAPGKPASSAEQAGFKARNGSSYAAFPAGTKIRRLTQASVAGRTFVLLGFKSGESLCLRLVRADEPSSRGIDQCVTLRELHSSQAPALVAAEDVLEVGTDTTLADGIIGFADDTVRAIQYRTGHGAWKTATVKNNVFVALPYRKATLPRSRQPQPLSPIDQVRAVTRSGRTVFVPFVSGYVSYPNGLPSVPSYVSIRVPKQAELPGPTTTSAPFAGGTISWLVQHEPRGSSWRPAATREAPGKGIVYSRAVQPDPTSPLRVGLYLRTATGIFAPGQLSGPGALALCEHDLLPLGEPGGGYSCFRGRASGLLFPPGQPFHLGGFVGGQQLTQIIGVAADQIAYLKLYLGSGRVVPVALADNAFSVGAPTTQFPAKLVAYDSRGRVLALQVISGPAHPVPCPALATWPSAKLPATRSYQRLDLGRLTVDGKRLFGMTPAQVTAALGTPARAAGFKHLGFGEPAYFYGGTLPSGATLRVQFRREKNGVKVVELDFQGRGLTDARLGHLLNTPPQTLQQKLSSSYGYRLVTAYGSDPAGLGIPVGIGCSGVVASSAGRTQIDFGLNTYEDARPFINISSR